MFCGYFLVCNEPMFSQTCAVGLFLALSAESKSKGVSWVLCHPHSSTWSIHSNFQVTAAQKLPPFANCSTTWPRFQHKETRVRSGRQVNLTALFWGKGGVPWSRGPGVRTRRLRSILPECTCKLQALLLHLYRSFPSPLLAPTKESKNIKQLKKGRKCYFKLHALAQH